MTVKKFYDELNRLFQDSPYSIFPSTNEGIMQSYRDGLNPAEAADRILTHQNWKKGGNGRVVYFSNHREFEIVYDK